MNNQQPQIDLSQSTPVLSPSGEQIFQTGYVLRKVSKFLLASDEDAIVPIQIFYDKDMNICLELLHPELRQFYDNQAI